MNVKKVTAAGLGITRGTGTVDGTLALSLQNATAVAVPRMMVAILENFQEADGTVNIPEALRPYLPGNPAKISPSK